MGFFAEFFSKQEKKGFLGEFKVFCTIFQIFKKK